MLVLRRSLLILALALVAASCSTADTLATVNDSEISKDDLFALRPSYEDTSGLSSEGVRQDLTLLIVLEAITDAAAEEFGFELTETDIDERISNPPARYASVIAPPEELDDVTATAIRASAAQSLVRDAVLPQLVLGELGGFEDLLRDRPAEVTRSCVRHISTATEVEAREVLERLESGEEFVTVAAEVSLDQASPGGLLATADGDCLVWLTRVGPEFSSLAATAPLNTPAGPVVAGQTWDIILVEERLAPASAAELANDPMEWLDPDFISAAYTTWLNDAVRNAQIDVSPTVGRWSEVGIGIAPPGE